MAARVGYINDVTDFKINDMVQQVNHPSFADRPKFNGVVVGFTVNSIGEAILLVDMMERRDTTVETMEAAGFEPVKFTHNAFWHRVTPMHPSSVDPFHDTNNLVEDS